MQHGLWRKVVVSVGLLLAILAPVVLRPATPEGSRVVITSLLMVGLPSWGIALPSTHIRKVHLLRDMLGAFSLILYSFGSAAAFSGLSAGAVWLVVSITAMLMFILSILRIERVC